MGSRKVGLAPGIRDFDGCHRHNDRKHRDEATTGQPSGFPVPPTVWKRNRIPAACPHQIVRNRMRGQTEMFVAMRGVFQLVLVSFEIVPVRALPDQLVPIYYFGRS